MCSDQIMSGVFLFSSELRALWGIYWHTGTQRERSIPETVQGMDTYFALGGEAWRLEDMPFQPFDIKQRYSFILCCVIKICVGKWI